MECLQFDLKRNKTELSFITVYVSRDRISILLLSFLPSTEPNMVEQLG